MKYEGILIVGDENYKYKELAYELSKSKDYKLLRVISDDNECSESFYIETENLDKIAPKNFLVKWKFMENIYAIFREEFVEILNQNKVPIIILPQNLFESFDNAVLAYKIRFMSIYAYYPKDKLKLDIEEIENIQKKSHIYKNKCTYSINNVSINASSKLVKRLWELQETGGILSRDLIKKMIKCDLLIEGAIDDNISNASYDLTLGDEYYYAGKINKLSDKNPFIAIEPYDYVIASCDEKIIMPRDVSARFDVSVNLFCQGIILSNSTQVDPGFRGKLFCLLFNTSNKVVYLKRKMHYATIEFNKLIEPTTSYTGKYADEDSIVPYLPPNVMQGAINELKKEIEKLNLENQKMQSIYLSALALFLAIVSIFLVIR